MRASQAGFERTAVPAPRPRSAGVVLRAAWRSLRPHQWLKNAIVGVPLAAAHRVGDRAAVVATAQAVLAFCLVASAAYLVNDLADRRADAGHPRKRLRPVASGELPGRVAMALVPLLLLAGGLLAAWLPAAFGLLLGGYALAALAYTFFIRRRPALDVIVLAGLYTARIFAGGFATGISVSDWLTSFSMFLFLSLAFLKRAAELTEADPAADGRGYTAADRETVLALGSSAGLMSAVVLTLYVSSPEVGRLYSSPRRLWALCPLLLYWIAHLWLRVRRGTVRDDPVVVALSDRVTWAVVVLGAAVVFAAT